MRRPDAVNFVVQCVLLIVVIAWVVNFRMQVREMRRRLDNLGHRIERLEKQRIEIDRQLDEVRRWQQRQDAKLNAGVAQR